MDTFVYSFKSAHPNAQALMPEEFYWSPIEETAPFGSDDGSDAAYSFREWRLMNKLTSPVTYLKDLIEKWQYPYFDYHEMDTIKIKEFLNYKKEYSKKDILQEIKTLRELNKDLPDAYIHQLDDKQLREFITSSAGGMGGMYLSGQDNAIIGTGFAQFVSEGRMDADMKDLTATAIKRQMLPLLIDRYDENYREQRRQQLTKMLKVINQATL
jgi:uncharacterized protein YfeS